MAKKKQTGNAHSAASRSRSRPGGRTPLTVRSGTAPDALRSITIRRVEPTVVGPFQSEAFHCWRIEYMERSGEFYESERHSSFWIERAKDAEELGEVALSVRSWDDWMALAVPAVRIASRSSGFLYRTIAGDSVRERFPDMKRLR